jgi:hypothetical protein
MFEFIFNACKALCDYFYYAFVLPPPLFAPLERQSAVTFDLPQQRVLRPRARAASPPAPHSFMVVWPPPAPAPVPLVLQLPRAPWAAVQRRKR